MQDDEVRKFEEWMKDNPHLATYDTRAAWHARDAEVAAFKEHERLAVAEAIRRAAEIADAEFVSYHDAANRIRALIPAADSRLLDERIAAERREVMIWCTGAMSLNDRDNAVIQKAIAQEEEKLAKLRATHA